MNYIKTIIALWFFSSIYTFFSTPQWIGIIYMLPVGVVMGCWLVDIKEEEEDLKIKLIKGMMP